MIDLSLLAPPAIIDSLDYETILAQLKADAAARLPDLAELLELESEPAHILLQVVAYRELLLRQRINEAARAVMLAYATGTDLDQIGGNYGIPRLVLTPANPGAVPPVPAVMEGDGAFRQRILLSLERFSTAGSAASYEYHARSASAAVQDAAAVSPTPGYVTVYVLAHAGTGEAPPELLATVAEALNAETVRPMTDHVTVLSASIVTYSVAAHLVVSNGPDAETIRLAALAACQAYVGTARRLNQGASLSGIYQALHQPGVTRVQLASPLADIVVAEGQASHCLEVTLTAGEEIA
jgi:phage-related baseplate assembly protein